MHQPVPSRLDWDQSLATRGASLLSVHHSPGDLFLWLEDCLLQRKVEGQYGTTGYGRPTLNLRCLPSVHHLTWMKSWLKNNN